MPLPITMVSPGAAASIACWMNEEQPPAPPGLTQRVAAAIGSDMTEIRMPVMMTNTFSEPFKLMTPPARIDPADPTLGRAILHGRGHCRPLRAPRDVYRDCLVVSKECNDWPRSQMREFRALGACGSQVSRAGLTEVCLSRPDQNCYAQLLHIPAHRRHVACAAVCASGFLGDLSDKGIALTTKDTMDTKDTTALTLSSGDPYSRGIAYG